MLCKLVLFSEHSLLRNSQANNIFCYRALTVETVELAELEIVVCSDKFVGTALVPTKLVGTAIPTNLSEQTTWCSNRKYMR